MSRAGVERACVGAGRDRVRGQCLRVGETLLCRRGLRSHGYDCGERIVRRPQLGLEECVVDEDVDERKDDEHKRWDGNVRVTLEEDVDVQGGRDVEKGEAGVKHTMQRLVLAPHHHHRAGHRALGAAQRESGRHDRELHRLDDAHQFENHGEHSDNGPRHLEPRRDVLHAASLDDGREGKPSDEGGLRADRVAVLRVEVELLILDLQQIELEPLLQVVLVREKHRLPASPWLSVSTHLQLRAGRLRATPLLLWMRSTEGGGGTPSKYTPSQPHVGGSTACSTTADDAPTLFGGRCGVGGGGGRLCVNSRGAAAR
eukprot:scaffold914_cov99-Isochrysis_galbana.AAC.2